MGTEMERHARFVQKLGMLVSRFRMNLLGSYFILGYFRNLEQLFVPWWLLPVFSYTAQIHNLTHVGIQRFCLNGDWQGSRVLLLSRPASHTAFYNHTFGTASRNSFLEAAWRVGEKGWRRESHPHPSASDSCITQPGALAPNQLLMQAVLTDFSQLLRLQSLALTPMSLVRVWRALGALCISCTPCPWHIMLFFFTIWWFLHGNVSRQEPCSSTLSPIHRPH